MFRAVDDNNENVFPEHALPQTDYFCPGCHATVRLRNGKVNIAHFYHLPGQPLCPYKEDKDYMSEWHRRMQGFFPRDCREAYFTDEETGESRRADVYLKDSKVVIEFQKSPMDPDEFYRRTSFYLKQDCRIAWVFDASTDNPILSSDMGNLRALKDWQLSPWREAYPDAICCQWLYHKKCLPPEGDQLDIKIRNPLANYAVLVYTGTEDEDCVHKIIDETLGYKYVAVTAEPLRLSRDFDPEDLFRPVDANDDICLDDFFKSEKARQPLLSKNESSYPYPTAFSSENGSASYQQRKDLSEKQYLQWIAGIPILPEYR